jgi:hypothetical protein
MYLYVLAGLCVRVCIGASRKEVHLTAATTTTTTQYLDSMTVLCWLVFASLDLDLCTTKKADGGRALWCGGCRTWRLLVVCVVGAPLLLPLRLWPAPVASLVVVGAVSHCAVAYVCVRVLLPVLRVAAPSARAAVPPVSHC